MNPFKIYSVRPLLPDALQPLREIASNLLFAWNSSVEDIFIRIDPSLWTECERNPIQFLNRIPQRTLEELAADEIFLERLKEAHNTLRQYTAKTGSPLDFPSPDGPVIAYFSLEYGIDTCLPIYSGGLGMLAGDHLKSASDLNIPLIGIGLCYQQGYFRQYLTPDGWQQERYPINDFEQMPLAKVRDEGGDAIRIDVDLAGETLEAQIRRADVGRIRLFLLDTDIPENPPHLRQITSQLYGGDLEMRLRQEILLGIGGVKALRAMNLQPLVIHMNEGHSAFAGLERIRSFMEEHGLPFEAAMELTAAGSVFTTHTPVPAGNDRFPPDLMQRYFESYAHKLGLAFKVFMAYGREMPHDDAEFFCMTVLALRLSRFNNGVSRLHGRVSRNMWKRLWQQFPVEDVPIGSVTNGVHASGWAAADMAMLFDRQLGADWREDPDSARAWAKAESISEAELWRTHCRLRARLVDFVRLRLKNQLMAKGVRRKALESAEEVLDPEALTIGFARRFAVYKRAYLLLMDKDRLTRLVNDKDRPVQFVFAGKAHPQDNEGKKLIQDLVQFCRTEPVRMRLIFLEDYDMEIARHMVQGCDVWLNTPRRPLEACGTSGMKAMVNGVLNFGTIDGWWDEAYRSDNSVGWGIGRGEDYEDHEYQDFVESRTLYYILENEIIPDFYDRGPGGMPRSWVRKMKRAFRDLMPIYNSHRMVMDYANFAYLPAADNSIRLSRDGFAPAKDLASWRMDVMTKWNEVKILNVKMFQSERIHVGETVQVEADVALAGLRPHDVSVEIYYGPTDNRGRYTARFTKAMHPKSKEPQGLQHFTGEVSPGEAGRFGVTVRILPAHPLLLDPHSLGLIHWADAPAAG